MVKSIGHNWLKTPSLWRKFFCFTIKAALCYNVLDGKYRS
jgi:hypothetical protein